MTINTETSFFSMIRRKNESLISKGKKRKFQSKTLTICMHINTNNEFRNIKNTFMPMFSFKTKRTLS